MARAAAENSARVWIVGIGPTVPARPVPGSMDRVDTANRSPTAAGEDSRPLRKLGGRTYGPDD